jgi:BlaI family transcriptional regulator, penicillinase repressor
MSAKHDLPNPTPGELEILQILWRLGPCSVKEVCDEMNKRRKTQYTTALKMLQIMTEKGLAFRKEVGRAHIYTAGQSQERTQQGMVEELLDRAFGGATDKLIMQALNARKTTAKELAEIKRILAEMEEQGE